MSSKKHRRRARRRAEKSSSAAWSAFEAQDLSLADKLSLRAVTEGPMNPKLWKERAELLAILGKRDEAMRAAKQALALAPSYEEAKALCRELRPSDDREATRAAATGDQGEETR